MGNGKIEATNQNTVLVSSKLKEGMTLTEAEKAGTELLKAFQSADGKGENGKADGILTLEEKLAAQMNELDNLKNELEKTENNKVNLKIKKAEAEIMQTKYQIAQKIHKELEKEKLEEVERMIEAEKQKIEEDLENRKTSLEKEKTTKSIKNFNGLA